MTVAAAPRAAAPAAGEDAADAALREAWRAQGAAGEVLEELVAYSRGGFTADAEAAGLRFPLPDEPFVAAWEGYAAEAAERGVWPCLRDRLVQLRFPVEAGMSECPEYQAATRRGILPATGEGLRLRAPESLRLWLHPTLAGRIPVLLAPDREDFEALVRALTRRNEPAPVPASMGACIVSGYNNWDRVGGLRRAWQSAHPGASEAEWQQEFRALMPRKELYQDRFILLSEGFYSATPPQAVGLDADEWLRLSRVVRLEHECAHYFTRRVFGSMRNSLHDELVADWAGITAAVGRFRRDWFLRFMGLEDHPRYRAGGRLENYRGTPPLSDAAFAVLRATVVRAADRLERTDAARPEQGDDPSARADALRALAAASLPALAGASVPPARG